MLWTPLVRILASSRAPGPLPRRRGTAWLATAFLAAAAVVGGGATASPAAAAGGAAADRATAVLAGMSQEQRVGQVFMVGGAATGVDATTRAAVADRHVGNVMLTGRSSAGVAGTARVTARLQSLATAAATDRVPLLVATDQEGGRVQVLSGPGFSSIPTALVQGDRAPGVLRRDATGWGRQLRRAGVGVNLAPVMDTVPGPAAAADNPPIGVYQREYGFTPSVVASHGTAFATGMAAAGVAATAKHFPGLGRVDANTDTSTGVTDRVTTRRDRYVAPFGAAVDAGVPFLMTSHAVYARIDPRRPAAFSPTVITGMARSDLGFTGVVVSDSMAAAQVGYLSPAARALTFLGAGGDMVLITTPSLLAPMYDAVLARTRRDLGFRARVDAAALRVLRAKADLGLLDVLPRSNEYFLSRGLEGGVAQRFRYARDGDETVTGRWRGGARDVVAVRRGNRFYLPARNGGGAPTAVLAFGRPRDEVVVGDWDGDGADSIALRRGNRFYVVDSLGGPVVRSFSFGSPDDQVVVGDWDGDGADSIALRRGATVFLTAALGGPVVRALDLGRFTDVPLAGDWDGDGRDTVALRRGQLVFVAAPDGRVVRTARYGRPTDMPLAGDWDGDGRDDLGLRR